MTRKELDECLHAALSALDMERELSPKQAVIASMALKVLHGFLVDVATIAASTQIVALRLPPAPPPPTS